MAQTPTNLTAILRAIKDRLVALEVFGQDQVWFALRMNPPAHTQADQYAIILPLTQFTVPDYSDGAGRYSKVKRGRLNVYLRNRSALDQAHRDEEWLLNEERGVLPKLDDMEDALDGWLVEDRDGNALTIEPMVSIFQGEPHKNYHANEWGDVVTEWEILYWRSLTTTDGRV